MQALGNKEIPDFIVKSTLGVSLTSFVLLAPFAILNFLEYRYIIGIAIVVILSFCSINIWLGLKNKYDNGINLLGAFILTVSTIVALYERGVTGSYWGLLAVFSFYFVLSQKQARIVNLLFLSFVIPTAWHILDQTIAIRFCAVLIGTSLFALISTREIYKQHYLLIEQSTTDSLTALYNRSLLQSSLENAIHQSYRSNTPMAILMLDIDDFKIINDQFGHDGGDTVLKESGAFLNTFFRSSDIVFRIGGEEFLALIYNTDEAGAINVANKLRKEFEQLPLIPNHAVTLSIGVASLQQNMDWKQWMKQGDTNLYKAKDNGRNQVVA